MYLEESKIEKNFFCTMTSSSVPKAYWEFAFHVMTMELKNKFTASNSVHERTEEDLPEDPKFFCDKILYLRYMYENALLQQLQNVAHFVPDLVPDLMQKFSCDQVVNCDNSDS